MEPLKTAKEYEKKYEWLQASKEYKKASDLATKNKDFIKAAEFQEQVGYCLYRSALQTQTNLDFRKRIRQSIRAYQKEWKILEEEKIGNKHILIQHTNALIAYTKSWIEKNPSKKKKLLTKSWTLEKQVLSEYEHIADAHSVGKICNDLLEHSYYDRFWLVSNHSEHEKMANEILSISEKAIQALSTLNDDYELARAYCFATWYSSWAIFLWGSKDKTRKLNQKCQNLMEKALELSHKTGDSWLISHSYIAALHAIQLSQLNLHLAVEYGEKAVKYGKIAKDNFLIGYGNCLPSLTIQLISNTIEDPDKQKECLEKGKKKAEEAIYRFKLINHIPRYSHLYLSWIINSLASIETDQEKKHSLLRIATNVIQEGLELSKGWKRLSSPLFHSLSNNLYFLSETKNELEEKRKLLQKAETCAKKFVKHQEKMVAFGGMRIGSYGQLAFIQNQLAKIEQNKSEKITLLKRALKSIEKCTKILAKGAVLNLQSDFGRVVLAGDTYNTQGNILKQIFSLTKNEKIISQAIESYQKAVSAYEMKGLTTRTVESYWHIAQLNSEFNNNQEASKNYDLASKAYDQTAKKIPQLAEFYKDYSLYMQAWSQIEQAKHSHSIENYEKAKEHYEQSAELHEKSEPWSYLAPNYFAWATVEEAESLSRKEQTEKAKQTFQNALEKFKKARESIKEKLEKISSEEEKEMTQSLFKASNLRRKYCQARILMEEAKLLDRKGKYLQSSKKYNKAAQNISKIVVKIDEAERKELEYVAILCRAWEKMAKAEETTSSESYLEAAELFEKAKDHCYTKKASLWALGNSSFCRGLAAGIKYQISVSLSDNALAKRHIKNAASSYLQAGLKNASEYAKATQRLFDAYVFMNQAESEVDPEKKVKQYQMAENLLQIAAGSFIKAKQLEKTAQVEQILKTVREEKKLALSLTEVMHAPTVTSSTFSFTAPTPTNEASVGLESFQHANVQANLVTQVKEVRVGEAFCLSVEFVNAGREPALLMRVEDFVPSDFVVVKKPEIYRIEENCLNMKGKQLAPLKLVEVKLTLQPSKRGKYQLNPKIYYLDELGQNKSLQLKTLEIKVEEVVLSDRISTGTQELDSLLLGGIPEEYAVALAGSPSDEREYLIRNFLEAGIKDDEIVYYVSTEAEGLEHLLENSSFYLFLCNPKPKTHFPELPNVYKLRSKTDLTNLSISLAKAYRNIDQSKKKRICVDIVSNVLLDYEAKATCMWVSELITDLGAKGFTMLAVMNPIMHPSDQTNAVIDLFDGEIELTQNEDPLECKKSIRVRKLRNQDYIKNPICLTNK